MSAEDDRARQLAYRRLKLRAQCAAERKQLGAQFASVEREFTGIDRAVTIARRFATKPAIIATGVALLTLIGPKRAVRWVSQGAFWYSTLSKVAKSLAAHKALSARHPRMRILDHTER